MDRCGTPRAVYRINQKSALETFHVHIALETHTNDAIIDLMYSILAAHAMGLGTCALSLIPPAVNKWGPLKKLFQIPETNEVLAAMVVGYPKYRFQRGIKRELARVIWM